MLRSILVALDGSRHSEAALELALKWAVQAEAVLGAVAVVDEPAIRQPEPVPMGAGAYKAERDRVLLAREQERIAGILDAFAARCRAAGVRYEVMEDTGVPGERILTEARRFDLLILGRQTHFEFSSGEEPDQTLDRVLREGTRPVMIVPENWDPASSAGPVLAAYNGCPESDRALQALAGLDLARGDAVYVASTDADPDEALRLARQAVDFLARHDVGASPLPLPAGDTAQAILAQADALGARLLVMGAFGRSPWAEFFWGSVTSAILAGTTRPLLLSH